MLYIKLDSDMHLGITVNEPIYRGDNLSKKIIYLIPKQLNEIDMLTATVFLNYIRADGHPDVVMLNRNDTPYNDSYFQYTFPIRCRLTAYPGEVCTWMQIYTGSPSNPIIAKSSECVLQIQASRNMDDYLCDHTVTALYQLSKKMNTAISDINDAIEKKADNIVFNSEDNTIQLSSGGTPIGDRIKVSTIDGAVVTNAGITTDGELILIFSDGTIKNLGNVIDSNGVVYVPHLSDRKILSFTIEDKPTGVPEPVDLNPWDEWFDMDESGLKSDYIWEDM